MALNNISELSTTAASNTDLAGTSILGTGLVSTADDSFRNAASFLAKWWNDLGAVNTVGGTGDAVTVTTLTLYTALKTGMLLRFVAGAANTTAATLNLDAIGAKAIRKISGGTDVALAAGDLAAGETYTVIYRASANSAAGAWVIVGAAAVAAATTSAFGTVKLASSANVLAPPVGSTLVPTIPDLYFPTNHLAGLGLTNSGADSIVIAVGTARSSDDTANIILTGSLTKSVAVAWAVGSAQGGLDTGSVGNSDYYLWLIMRPDTGVVDALFSLSGTAPTMPTNYTKKALIGKFTRVSATNNAPRSYAADRLGATDWVAWTPTFTAFGTAASIFAESCRRADTLVVRLKFTTGTVTGSEARVSLGFNGTDGNVVTSAAKVPSLQLSGSWFRNAATAAGVVLADTSVGYINFASGAAPLTKLVGTSFGSSEVQIAQFEVPIQGW